MKYLALIFFSFVIICNCSLDVDDTCFSYVLFNGLQLLDLPGIIEGAKDGKGRGRQVSRISECISDNLNFVGRV